MSGRSVHQLLKIIIKMDMETIFVTGIALPLPCHPFRPVIRRTDRGQVWSKFYFWVLLFCMIKFKLFQPSKRTQFYMPCMRNTFRDCMRNTFRDKITLVSTKYLVFNVLKAYRHIFCSYSPFHGQNPLQNIVHGLLTIIDSWPKGKFLKRYLFKYFSLWKCKIPNKYFTV